MTSPASESLKEIHIRLDQRIRSVDEPRWLSSRYALAEDRVSLTVLYAFYYELARVRVVVTDQTMAQIRYQWWRDALQELARGDHRQHDVVLALAHEIDHGRIQIQALSSLIDRHETAFLEQDRSLEPENELIAIAANIIDPEASFDRELGGIAGEWAALRRDEAVAAAAPRHRIPARLRPVAAHLRLRHLWRRNREPSALQVRLTLLMAMLTGRV